MLNEFISLFSFKRAALGTHLNYLVVLVKKYNDSVTSVRFHSPPALIHVVLTTNRFKKTFLRSRSITSKTSSDKNSKLK